MHQILANISLLYLL